MPLDPQIQTILTHFQTQFENHVVSETSIDETRKLIGVLHARENVETMAEVLNVTTDGENPIPIRIYRPSLKENLPVLVFFHGGGFVTGNVDTADGLCRSLANGSQSVVMSVDYRLAPEHPFPAAVEDCYQALQWAVEHAKQYGGNPNQIILGGDSAGGNLAASVSLMCRDRKGPKLQCQLLIYPMICPDFESPTYKEFAQDFFIERAELIWSWDQYVPNAQDRTNPYASPICSENLRNLPPAIIITAEFDPLRHEGEAYAQKLRENEVPVVFKRFPGMIHGFLIWDEKVDLAKRALVEICDTIKWLINQESFRV